MHSLPQPDPSQPLPGQLPPGYPVPGQPVPGQLPAAQPMYGHPAPGQPPLGYGFPGQVPPPPVHQTFQGMPGQAVAVRVLMFIGGPIGILLGLFFGAIALLGFGLGEMAGEADEGVFSLLAAFTGAIALVPLIYGIVSTTLASLMGRRRAGLLWGVVAFHGVASLILLAAVIAGDYLSLVPLAFAAVMIGLMLAPRVREFYLS